MTERSEESRVILGKIASLTSIRDIDVFEFSFLQTLASMLSAKEICIYKFNNIQEPCHLLRYTSEVEESDAGHKVEESKEIQITDIEIPEDIKQAKAWIESTGKVYSIQRNGVYHMVYPIAGLKGNVGYLSIDLYKKLTDTETLIISSLLSISQNFHSLLEENQKDKLTGLLNRKTFDDNIFKIQDTLNSIDKEDPYEGEDKRDSESASHQYWLAILDIDHFKKVNDTFGHVYGDEVLLLLSQIMRKTFRPQDLLFRFGGEEFVVVVQVKNEPIAKNVFERFRIAIESFDFPGVGQVTISGGMTQIREQHAIASDIVGRADQALYYAKENGRNRLFSYEELLASGTFEEVINEGDIELF